MFNTEVLNPRHLAPVFVFESLISVCARFLPLNPQGAAKRLSGPPQDTGSELVEETEQVQEEESYDYGCIKRTPADSSPLTAAEPNEGRQEIPAAPGGEVDVGSTSKVVAEAASAVVSEGEEEESDLDEELTDKQLLDAITNLTSSVDDLSLLTLKQV